MNGPFIISRGQSGECHCAFQTSLCYYSPLFALHVILSSDWLSWHPGCFSRHPWIPLIQPSFKSFHVCRHLPSTIPPHGGVSWGEAHGMGRLPSRALVTIEGLAESCNSVLHLCKVCVEVRIWVQHNILRHGLSASITWWTLLMPPILMHLEKVVELRLVADTCLCYN